MTAMMIDDGKRVAAGGARLQWYMIPIADIDLLARNTGGKWGRVIVRGRWRVESLNRYIGGGTRDRGQIQYLTLAHSA
jgi:hypothetical protein